MPFIVSIFVILIPYPSVLHFYFLNSIRPALLLASVCSVDSSALDKNTSSTKSTKNTYRSQNIGKKRQKSVGGLAGKKEKTAHKP